MNVLIACEYSGVVRDAFTKQGHHAVSADLLPTETPGHHYQGNVLDILHLGWDLMIAHPPCTYLCNSGVRWLYEQPGRRAKLYAAHDFFMALHNAPIPMIAVENPIPHHHAQLPPYDQKIQPYHFGESESKATCLWLKNLPPLMTTIHHHGKPGNSIHIASPGPDRGKIRSKTFQGVADAMATQWGTL